MPKNQYDKRIPSHPGRVDLIPQEFDNLLIDHGSRVRITPAVICPNRSDGKITEVGSVNHDLDCPLCDGRMVIDLTDKAYETWAFIQGVQFDITFAPQSRFDIKDAFISTRYNNRLNYWFKIEVIDFGSLFNQVVLRKRGSLIDRLRYIPKEAFDGDFYDVIDESGNRYILGTHYTVTGRNLTWLGSTRPPDDRLYSIIYPVFPTFRVLEMVHANRYYYVGFKTPKKEPIQLPQQAHIRWDYLTEGGSNVPLS